MYICDNYPGCDTYVRCHPGTIEPMGTLAGPRLRRLRGIAHELFDPLWKSCDTLGRSSAYLAAAQVMGSPGEFHIGHLDEAGCNQFIARIDEVRQCYEDMLLNNQRLLLPPDEITVEIMLGLYHPHENDHFKRVSAEQVDRYPNQRTQALAHGWITPVRQDDEVHAYELTSIGVKHLYGQSD